MPALHKPCMLTLKLSSPSFLDTIVSDDQDCPALYAIRTDGATTRITRSSPTEGPTEISMIKWPPTNQKPKSRNMEGLMVQIRGGPWEAGENVLKSSSLFGTAPRKFNIPGYPKSLKWNAVGDRYWCVAPSIQGPIATLDPAVGSVPPRLKVFESLRDKHDASSVSVHHGVSVLLLDYLLVTSLLLVADSKDVALFQNEPHSSFLSMQGSLSWKRLIPRESLFARRSSGGFTSVDNLASSSTSSGQMAKIVHGDPIYPTLNPMSPDPSSVNSDSEHDESEPETEADMSMESPPSVVRMPSSSRPHSPSQESVCYPLRNASAPSHTYIDPSFYAATDAPPVPALPKPTPTALHPPVSRTPSISSLSIRRLPNPPLRPSYNYSSHARPQTAPSDESRRSRSSSGSSARSSSIDDNFIRRLPVPPRLRTLPEAPSAKDSWVLSPQVNASGSRVTVMELPPPPYNSIDFAVPEDTRRPLPPPPPGRVL